MPLVNKAPKIAAWYAGLSVLIGPAIAFLNMGRTPAYGDCGDGAWGNMPIDQRSALIKHVGVAASVEAAFMIVIGLVVVVLLLACMFKASKPLQYLSRLIAVLVIIGGYGLIIAVMGYGSTGCGFNQ